MTDVLLRPEVLRLLGGRHALDRALDAGPWQRLLRGTYAPGCTPRPAGAGGRRRARRGRPRRRDVHGRSAEVPTRDVVRLGPQAVPCLRPVRAVADLLRLLPPVEAVVVADAAQHSGLTDVDELRGELEAHAGPKGVVQARRALDLSDPRAESPPESRLRVALRGVGLAPVPQFVVLDADGRFVARVDLALPERRLAIEHDGRAVHEGAEAFVADRRRQNALVAAGWTVLRLTAADLRHGAAPAVAQVLGLLRAAA